jgi:hypothetical protein
MRFPLILAEPHRRPKTDHVGVDGLGGLELAGTDSVPPCNGPGSQERPTSPTDMIREGSATHAVELRDDRGRWTTGPEAGGRRPTVPEVTPLPCAPRSRELTLYLQPIWVRTALAKGDTPYRFSAPQSVSQ